MIKMTIYLYRKCARAKQEGVIWMAVAPRPNESATDCRETGGKQGLNGAAHAPAAPRVTAMLEDPSRSEQRIRGIVRAGAICLLLFQSVYLLQKLGSADAEQVLPCHLFNLGIGFALLALAFSPGISRLWRGSIVVACAATMASTSAIVTGTLL